MTISLHGADVGRENCRQGRGGGRAGRKREKEKGRVRERSCLGIHFETNYIAHRKKGSLLNVFTYHAACERIF